MVCGNIFKTLSIQNRKSQRAEILRECSSHTMCYVSCVICHVSRVMCHVSLVTCHVSPVTCHMSHVKKKIKQLKILVVFTTKACPPPPDKALVVQIFFFLAIKKSQKCLVVGRTPVKKSQNSKQLARPWLTSKKELVVGPPAPGLCSNY